MLISTVQVSVVLIFVGISLFAVIPLVHVESRLVGDNDALLGAGTFVNT